MKAIAFFNALDVATFALVMVVLPIAVEGNPLARLLWGIGGMAAIVAWKVIGVSIVGIARRHLTFGRTALSRAAVGIGIFGAAMNCLTLAVVAVR